MLPFGSTYQAGAMLPQPRVLLLDGRTHLLDNTLGDGWALLALADGADDPFAALRNPIWSELGARRVAIYPSERWPRPLHGVTQVVDAQDKLVPELWASGDRFVLIRPDRYIAGAFRLEDEAAAARDLARRLDLDPAHEKTQIDESVLVGTRDL